MAAKISISVTEPSLLEWAKQRADREGVSLSSVISDAIRQARYRPWTLNGEPVEVETTINVVFSLGDTRSSL